MDNQPNAPGINNDKISIQKSENSGKIFSNFFDDMMDDTQLH